METQEIKCAPDCVLPAELREAGCVLSQDLGDRKSPFSPGKISERQAMCMSWTQVTPQQKHSIYGCRDIHELVGAIQGPNSVNSG